MNYVVFDDDGKIRKKGECPDKDKYLQAPSNNRHVMEGVGDGLLHKVEFDGLDGQGQPINPRIVNKTQQEIDDDTWPRPDIPDDEKQKHIKKKDWDALQDTLTSLSDRITALEP